MNRATRMSRPCAALDSGTLRHPCFPGRIACLRRGVALARARPRDGRGHFFIWAVSGKSRLLWPMHCRVDQNACQYPLGSKSVEKTAALAETSSLTGSSYPRPTCILLDGMLLAVAERRLTSPKAMTSFSPYHRHSGLPHQVALFFPT
jgi:hypothetical protein